MLRRKRRDQGLGPLGESLAARFLEAKGWKILARGYRALGAEIDLVASDGDEIVFVEVKALRSAGHGFPEERVEASKQRRISRAAMAYVRKKRLQGANLRFDVVSVLMEGDEPKIAHYPEAFELHSAYDG